MAIYNLTSIPRPVMNEYKIQQGDYGLAVSASFFGGIIMPFIGGGLSFIFGKG